MFARLEPIYDLGHSRYESFLSTHVMQHLEITDLPVALSWVSEQTDVPGEKARRVTYYIGRLCDDITIFAWENIYSPEVASSLAQLAATRFSQHKPLLSRGDGYNF
jgi:hypothetical protein